MCSYLLIIDKHDDVCILQFERINDVFALAMAEDTMNKHGSRAGMSREKRQAHARKIMDLEGK